MFVGLCCGDALGAAHWTCEQVYRKPPCSSWGSASLALQWMGSEQGGARAGDEQVCWPGLLPLSLQHTARFLLYSGHVTLTFSIPKHSLCTCGKVSQLHDCHTSIWPYLSVLGFTA